MEVERLAVRQLIVHTTNGSDMDRCECGRMDGWSEVWLGGFSAILSDGR